MDTKHREEIHHKKLAYLDGTRLLLDPDEDVADLFQNFNNRFFWGKLKYVEVLWSPRMTLCAGLCVYKRRPGFCSIRLSRPLLSLRGKVDLVETLIHEMIHAYLFVTESNRDRDGHGPEFLKHMNRINKEVGLNISVYHTFSEEVRHYQQHVWLCNGPCQTRPPYFGKVYRAINRPPGPSDFWWLDHLENCSGSYSKISEPEGYEPSKKKKVQGKKERLAENCPDIRSFFKPICTDTSTNKMPAPDVPNLEDKKMSLISTDNKTVTSKIISGIDTHNKNDINNSKKVIDISSDESNTDSEDNASDTNSNIFGIFESFGSIFNMPFRFLKRKAEDVADPQTIKIRKPDLNAVSKSKRRAPKNLIKVPDQPTLDAFYQKKKSSASMHKSMPDKFSTRPRKITGNLKTLHQPLLKSFLKKDI